MKDESVFAGGIEVELLKELKKYFKFQYDVLNCNENWGNYINGTWTGVIGNVLYNVKLLTFI